MSRPQGLLPRTLLVRTFLLISLLIFVSVATWLTLFGLAEREPRARQLGQLAASVVNLTSAALVAADPVKRLALLRDLAEREGLHVYPAEPSDSVEGLPASYFFRVVSETATTQLGAGTRLARSVNGQAGIWVSFSVGDSEDDDYWLMLPGGHAESEFPWHWLGWGGLSLALALLVAWLIVSRVTLPLRALASAAREVGRGGYPEPVAESGAIELRHLAMAFNRMSDNLKRIDAERAEILAGISHDLRTPLARLRLEAEMSICDTATRDAVVEDIEQMDAIIAQFLAYARGERAEPTELADLNAVVSHASGLHARSANEPVLSFGVLPPTRIHPQAMARAVANLLDNARKYGGNQIEVETRAEYREIVIDVLDRGPGIPEGEVDRLKRPFTRLENARTDGNSTGLGLAIVERIARLHDGTLELLPRDGGGLIARLRLPVRS